MTAKPKSTQPPRPDSELVTLQQQLADLTQALQRERADATNLRRRHEAELSGLRSSVKAQVIRDLLPVVDNFERALKHVPKDLEDNDYIKGVETIVKQFEKVLADMGVERIETVGAQFDPSLHEAVSVEEGEGEHEVITEELQAGYQIGNDIVRHAMVRVGRQ